jgi:hypothetical protein
VHEPPRAPPDFLGEVELELEQARVSLDRDRDRLRALRELEAVAAEVAAHLGRRITVFDFVRSAAEGAERARRLRLVRLMRGTNSRPTEGGSSAQLDQAD